MNPLSPRWQHDDPDVRLQAVNSGKLKEEVLKQLAEQDVDPRVTKAALDSINDVEFLARLCEKQTQAAERWAMIVGADLQNLGQVTSELSIALIKALAERAPKEEFRLAATDQLDEESICQVLAKTNLSRVHQHCAVKLENEDNISSFQKHFKDKDTNVSRILKSKLQVIRQEREIENNKAQALSELLANAKIIRKSEPEGDFERRVSLLQTQWQSLEDKQATAAVEIKQIIAECHDIIAALPKPEEILKASLEIIKGRCDELRNKSLEDSTSPTLLADLNAILKDWPVGDTSQLKDESTQDLSHLAEAQKRWQLLNSAKLSLEQYQKQLAELQWPEAFPKPKDFEETTQAAIASLEEKAAKNQKLNEQREAVEEALVKFEQEITAGHTKAANRANTKASRLVKESNPSDSQSSRYQQLEAKLQELKDWQGFATQPKRDELCKKMQTLAEDNAIVPLEKAKAIKELQEEWRKLGASDSRAAQRSWTQFKTFGDQAYAPVAEHFANQEAQRVKNLEARQEICANIESLELETDWQEGVDWRKTTSLLQSAEANWRKYGNVPRRDKKAIEKRFDAATKPIKDRIANEQQSNIDRKQALIENLKTLLLTDGHPVNDMINQAKAAQQAWKSIGFVERRKDQKLWKAFRTQCDAVFNRRDVEKKSEISATNEIVQQYKTVCKEFDKRLDDPFTRKDISNFRQEISNIELPSAQRGLDREVAMLIKRAEGILKDRVKQNEELMFREFQKRCQALDSGNSYEADDSISLSSELAKALDDRADRDIANQDLILIRLEILSELPSPETSQNARMAYQVERLNRELSQGLKETRSEREQARDLLTQWFVTKNKSQELYPRFQKIAVKLGIPM